MTEQKLRAMMQRSAEEPSEGFDERIAFQLMNLTRKEEPRMKRSASIIVVFALVLALGMSTALAAFNDDANQLLYQFFPGHGVIDRHVLEGRIREDDPRLELQLLVDLFLGLSPVNGEAGGNRHHQADTRLDNKSGCARINVRAGLGGRHHHAEHAVQRQQE